MNNTAAVDARLARDESAGLKFHPLCDITPPVRAFSTEKAAPKSVDRPWLEDWSPSGAVSRKIGACLSERRLQLSSQASVRR